MPTAESAILGNACFISKLANDPIEHTGMFIWFYCYGIGYYYYKFYYFDCFCSVWCPLFYEKGDY